MSKTRVIELQNEAYEEHERHAKPDPECGICFEMEMYPSFVEAEE